MAAATAWPVFVAGFLVMSLGGGIVDAGMNALMLDLSGGRAALLNRLHVFFALGALSVPLVIGLVLGAGLPWQGVALGTVAVAVPLAVLIGTRRLPPTHRDRRVVAEAERSPEGPRGAAARPARRRLPLPLVLLSIAIACYVATEYGVSSWLVRYLEDAPIEVATLALSLFWAALAAGRLLASFADDRVGAAGLAIGSALVCAVAIVAALLAPSLPFAVAAFAVAGLAAGPIYPAIVAVGGRILPDRASTVGSVLVSASIVGSLLYPPAMGVVSEVAGLGIAMLGAAVFAVASGVAVWVAVAGRSATVARPAA
jgi:fucose permease